ncbi:DUF6531 domain-containing protein [Streptomyces venezuelae]
MGSHRPSDWHVLDLEKDPTPGDPHRVRSLAKNLHDFADDVGKVLRDIKGMAGDEAILKWVGKTADAFTEKFEDAPDKLKKLRKSYEMAGDALSAYWPELERAQTLADKALVKGREAQADLSSAKSRLSSADSWVERAGKEADKYKDKPGGGKDVPKPDEDKVKAATRNAHSAEKAQKSAQGDVDSAKSALEAAKKMAADARKMREEAAGTAKKKIDEASDAGIPNRKWWEEVGDWVSDNWDTIVAVCKVVVAVVGIIAMIIGGPILAAIVIVAAVIVLADTLNKYAKGQAGLLDVAFAALDCVPGMKGLTTAAKLGKGLKGLKAMGLKGMAQGVKGLGKNAKNMLADSGRGAFDRARNVVRSRGSDPVDMATGGMFLPQIDITLPGALPLTFRRRVASDYRAGWWFGPTWASTVDQRLEVDEEGIVFVTEDGLLLTYPVLRAGDPPALPKSGPRWPLSRLSNGGYRVENPLDGLGHHFGSPVDGLARLELTTDRNGNSISYDYDEYGRPTGLRHSGGYHLKVEVEGGRVTSLGLGNAASDGGDVMVKRFGYDEQGNLAEDVNSSGLALRFTYDERLRVTSWTDRNDRSYSYAYDERDRCTAEGGEAGHLAVTLSYDGTDPRWPDCRVTSLTTAQGAVSRFVVNDRCQVIAEIDPLGGVVGTTYDANHHVVSRTDELGHVTRVSNTAAGLPQTLTRADGSTLRYVYDATANPTAVTLPDGSTWLREYDERGNCTAVTEPSGAVTRYTYDEAGHLVRVTDTLGHERFVQCNAAGLPTETSEPGGDRSVWTYDAFGRPATISDSPGSSTRLTWTTEGQLSQRTAPDGSVESWDYDGEGNCVSYVTPTGAVSRFTYTHFDLPASRTEPDGAHYTFAHDAQLRLTEVVNPQGAKWKYIYDAAGRLTSETDFDGRTLAYTRDAAGRLTSRTNACGQTIHFAYDAVGHVVSRTSDGRTTTFSYGLDDLLGHATNPDGITLTRLHDSNGQLTSESFDGRSLCLEYDQLGRRIRRTTASGAITAWEYDAAGNLNELTASGHSIRFDRDASGRELSRHIDGTVTLTHTFDELGLLSSQAVTAADGRSIQQRAYTYRQDGYPTTVQNQLNGTQHFTLDATGRVTSVKGRDWLERYAYDDAGNQVDAYWPATHPGHEATGGRSYSGTRLTGAGNVHYEHDAAGRIVLRRKTRISRKPEIWRYTWDAEDRLVSTTTPDGTHWHYQYDPLGRRSSKQRLADDGHTVLEQVTFTWDGFALCEQTTTGLELPNAISVTWDHLGLQPVAQRERVAALDAPQDEIDARFFAIVTDLVGSPTELIGESGEIAWRTRSTVWGTTSWNAGATAYTPLRFPGQYHDPETGLHYNCFRHYDPESGRYLTPDPLGLKPAPNALAYVHNPHVWADPLGLSPYYSEIAANGQRGPAYAEVTPQTLIDAQNNLIGAPAGRGRRYATPGFQGGAAGHSRGHLIGQQFGGDGRDMRNLVTQSATQNNGPISDAEGIIADHVRNSGNTVVMSVTPEYANGGVVPSHVLIEAADDYGWSFSRRLSNM